MRGSIDELMATILQNKPDDLAAALAGGANVNKALHGMTPLIQAVRHARPAMVELLLRHGANWKTRDRNTGDSPLMIATVNANMRPWKYFSARAIKDSKQIVQILTDAGASDKETELVLGNDADEAGLIAQATSRKLCGEERVLSGNGVLMLLPPRVAKALGADCFDTIAEHARQKGLRRLSGVFTASSA
jgi:ankyrin repeat protein